MRADLHVHSTASDGTCRPRELVSLALEAGLDYLSITDHDSVEGVREAVESAEGTHLTVIPGVELSSVTEDGIDVHMLGYFVDIQDVEFRAFLADLRQARLRRAESIVASLEEAGVVVSLERVLSLSDGGALGRSHIARVLVEAGHADSVADAFQRLIGHGKPHYVAKDVRSPSDAIAAIESAGGLAVVAHPGIRALDSLIRDLAARGLNGVEAYHADHTAEQRHRYAALAAELGLLRTGGSDFHGHGAPNPPLGSIDVPAEAIVQFVEAGLH